MAYFSVTTFYCARKLVIFMKFDFKIPTPRNISIKIIEKPIKVTCYTVQDVLDNFNTIGDFINYYEKCGDIWT